MPRLPLAAVLRHHWPTRLDQARPVIMADLHVSLRAPMPPRDQRGR